MLPAIVILAYLTEVDAALLQLEQEQLVLFTLVPTSKDKVKIFYRSGKDETSAKDQASSTPSPQPAAAAKVISPALKERLDRKRALTSPATVRQLRAYPNSHRYLREATLSESSNRTHQIV